MAPNRERAGDASAKQGGGCSSSQAILESTLLEVGFGSLLEAAPDAMLIVDRAGWIILANMGAERLFGYAAGELRGANVDMLVPERGRKHHGRHRTAFFEHARRRPMGEGLDLSGRRKDGSEFPAEISLAPTETAAGMLVTAAIRDVTERKRAEELRIRLAAIVDSTDDAIVSKTLDGIVTSWNRGAEQLFGYRADEMIGQSIAKIVAPGCEEEEERILQRLREGEGLHLYETVRRRKDGRSIDVSVTISPLRDLAGRLIGASNIARNITERKFIERDALRARERAELANRELEAFSYSVAHDLRAPLRSIDGFSQALLDAQGDSFNEEARAHLERVRSSAQHMARLIDGLLDLSRISREELTLRPVDLSALARQSCQLLRYANPKRDVRFLIAEGLNTDGDPRLLGILLDNLLGNAWKFTGHKQHARIEFGAEPGDAGPVYFVRDDGAGFDMSYASKLFSVFQRLHRRDEFEGTGIGLATAKRIVQRHGGRIWAHAQPGQGAAFHFTLHGAQAEP